MFYFPPNGLNLRSTIFVYSGASKAKSLQDMRISLIQTTWRKKRRSRAILALLSWKLSTFLLKMLSYTPRTVNWNYHFVVLFFLTFVMYCNICSNFFE